jgi:hypothetical protein
MTGRRSLGMETEKSRYVNGERKRNSFKNWTEIEINENQKQNGKKEDVKAENDNANG